MSPPPANLAQGVAHWDPPPAALQQMEAGLQKSTNHKYGPALGLPALRKALAEKLEAENGLDMTGQEVPYPTKVFSGRHPLQAFVFCSRLKVGMPFCTRVKSTTRMLPELKLCVCCHRCCHRGKKVNGKVRFLLGARVAFVTPRRTPRSRRKFT